jgi:SAM-dependent methyltransferase
MSHLANRLDPMPIRTTARGVAAAVRLALPFPKARLTWHRHRRALQSMTEMAQFTSYVSGVQPPLFLRYQSRTSDATGEFSAVLSELHLSLEGLRFLDIGPGLGETLDIAHEQGARNVEYVEIDPFFYTYNRLKGFAKGHRFNHVIHLDRLRPRSFDMIWAKGSIVADRFIAVEGLKLQPLSLAHWLARVELLGASGCHIVVCPFWLCDAGTRNIADVQTTSFVATMTDRGYAALPALPFHQSEPAYAISFHKVL